MEEAQTAKEPLEIEFNNRNFIYEFEKLCIEQAELAREAGEFKYDTLNNPPATFKELLKAGGADWLTTVARYLFVEMKNNEEIKFNRDRAEIEIDTFLKSLPVSERPKLQGAVEDFFSAIGKDLIGYMLLQSVRTQQIMQMLSATLPNTNAETAKTEKQLSEQSASRKSTKKGN
ncbi:MAG: hypothetical protein QG635_995 [Bacteroidota bacterium]|nr:hypothetical protein [Bacteroidota bacterium]